MKATLVFVMIVVVLSAATSGLGEAHGCYEMDNERD
jgi:hypothetical protein